MGVRLAIRQARVQAGDIALLYADRSEALTHPYLAHVWAEKGADLRVQTPGQSHKMAMSGEPLGSTLGALDAATRELLVHTSATQTSADFIALLELAGLAVWPQARLRAPARGAGARQRSRPYQPCIDGGAGGPALDHRRVAAAVCP